MPNVFKYLDVNCGRTVGFKQLANWASESRGELQRGPENARLLIDMCEAARERYGEKQYKLPASAFVHPAILLEELKKAASGIADWGVGPRLIHLLGFAITWQRWAYPALAWYYEANKYEDGVSKDFMTKHFSSTANEKSARSVAGLRSKPVEERHLTDPNALGRIQTARSGAMRDADQPLFLKEIAGRQAEFTEAHEKLCAHWAEHFLEFPTPDEKGLTPFDNLTFVTTRKYGMFEFKDAKLIGDGTFYVHFSVSRRTDGGWVVHHLSTTSDTRAPAHRHATLLNGLGLAVADPGGENATYVTVTAS